MYQLVTNVSAFIWAWPLVVFCFGAGIIFSILTRFAQVRYFKEMIRQIFSKKDSARGISPFQSLMLSLSGRLGTGNIVGVATAIAIGGPGAIFWMWIIAFFGASSTFAEATLGQIYKTKSQNEYRGGPSYYIEKGLGLRWYGIVFSISILLAYIIFLPGVQANAITTSLNEAFGISPTIVGIVMVFSLVILIRGGIKGFATFSQYVIPIMTVAYLVMAWVIIALNIAYVPQAFMLILRSAMGIEEVFAGLFGAAISYGVRRGMFSTEAGMGTQVSAAAAAETNHPVKQGLVQAFSIYIDTFVVSTSTAFMILVTDAYNVLLPNGGFAVQNIQTQTYAGPEFAIYAVEQVFAGFGSALIAIAIFFFAYTVFVTYYYVAETNLIYIFKGKKIKILHWFIELAFLFFIFVGSVAESDQVWAMADIGIGISAWINLVAILLLWRPLVACFKDYENSIKKGKEPMFNSKKVGIKNAEFWDK